MTKLCRKKRRGFNLIEAAIVLGVVGLVVAGVWVAAAAISERREINNAKEFILYAQGLALKYRQNYPLPSNYLTLSRVMTTDTALPGGFTLYPYSPTYFMPVSENNKLYVNTALQNDYTQDSYNVSGSFNWWVFFVDYASTTTWTYVPRPVVCAGLLSWAIAQAAQSPVLLGYADVSSPSTKLYWDARTGAAPPSIATCQTIVKLDVFVW